MVAVDKSWKRRLAPLFVFPLVLLPALFLFTRYHSKPATPPPNASKPFSSLTQPEPAADADLDHDGLPDNSELRSFNDRDSGSFLVALCQSFFYLLYYSVYFINVRAIRV